jgi:glycosyltransferase involved in cell wall biosynthesis
MRIAVLTSLYPSAVRPYEGIFAERRWSAMRARGHDVYVVHPLPRAPLSFVGRLVGRPQWGDIARMAAREELSGIAIDRPRYAHIPGRALANARAFARSGVARILAGPRPDAVVADYAWPAAAAWSELAGQRLPFLIHGRGSDVLQVAAEPALRAELALALRSSGHWAAVSRHLVDAMDELASAPGRGRLIPNGVDLARFPIKDRDRARHRLGVAAAPVLVLVVGHLIPRKDPLLALEAFASALPAPAVLVFVGAGELEAAVRARARELGVTERVRLIGQAPPDVLADWYGACDVLLLTSSREGRPNVVLEALSAGRRVLATDAGGTKELLLDLDGAGARLAHTRVPRELGEELRRVVEGPHDPERLRASVAPLSWDASLTALEQALASAVEAPPAP